MYQPENDYPYHGFHPGDQPAWLKWLTPVVAIVTVLVLLALASCARPAYAGTPVQADPAPLSLACDEPGGESLSDALKVIEQFGASGPMKLDHHEVVTGARAVLLAEHLWPDDDDNGEVTALVIMSAERFGSGVRVVFFMNGCNRGFDDLPASKAIPLRGA